MPTYSLTPSNNEITIKIPIYGKAMNWFGDNSNQRALLSPNSYIVAPRKDPVVSVDGIPAISDFSSDAKARPAGRAVFNQEGLAINIVRIEGTGLNDESICRSLR